MCVDCGKLMECDFNARIATIGDHWLWKWQFNQPMGSFWTHMTKALETADGNNLDRLALAFPSHVEAIRSYRGTPGYWEWLVRTLGRPPASK